MSKILSDTINAATWNHSLKATFGPEWLALSALDRLLIIKDCTSDGGVADVEQYRRNIGAGNLSAYVLTQRVRFGYR